MSKTIDRNVRGFVSTIIKGRLHIDSSSTDTEIYSGGGILREKHYVFGERV